MVTVLKDCPIRSTNQPYNNQFSPLDKSTTRRLQLALHLFHRQSRPPLLPMKSSHARKVLNSSRSCCMALSVRSLLGHHKTGADHNYRSQRLHGQGTPVLTCIVNLTNLRFRGYFSTRHFGNLKLPLDGHAWSYQDCMAQQDGTYTEEHTLKYLKRGDKPEINRLLEKIVSV